MNESRTKWIDGSIPHRLYRAALVVLWIEAGLTIITVALGVGMPSFNPPYPITSAIEWLNVLFTYTSTASNIILLAGMATAIAWFKRYPRTARIGVFLVASSFSIYFFVYYWDWELWRNSDYLLLILMVYTSFLALFMLFLVPFMSYLSGIKNRLQLLLVSLTLLLITMKALEAAGLSSDFFEYDVPIFEVSLILAVAWLALARTKLGWALVLWLCIYEVVTTTTEALAYSNFSLREPFIPIIIACLLCTPAVFRWYFPKKELGEVAGEAMRLRN